AAPKSKKKKSRRRSGRRNQRRMTRAFTIWTLPHRPKPKPAEPPKAETPPPSGAPAKPVARTKAFTIWTRPSQAPAQPTTAATPTPKRTKAFSIWTLAHLPKPIPKKAPVASKPAAPALTPEEIAVLQDLRWLIREGYVIEFSNGTLKLPREHVQQKKREPKKKVAAPAGAKPVTPAANAEPKAASAPAPEAASTPDPEAASAPEPNIYPKPNNTPTVSPPSTKPE
ncbi:MAG: hypothetical protein ACI8XO_002044, partial [Verrucomicrobiales bacterium]